MFIGGDHTAYGTPYQPLSVGDLKYRSEMKIDIKNVLWDNVSALMDSRYKKENLTQMAKDSGVGNGTMTRIKNQETSVGIDTLEKLAVIAKVKPWQLMQPNMGAGLEPPNKARTTRVFLRLLIATDQRVIKILLFLKINLPNAVLCIPNAV